MHTHTHARNELSNLPGRSYMPRVRPWVSGFAWPVQKRTLCRMAYTSDGLCIWLVRRVGVSVSGPTITDDPNTTYFESLRFEMLTVTLPQSVATKSSFHLKYVPRIGKTLSKAARAETSTTPVRLSPRRDSSKT